MQNGCRARILHLFDEVCNLVNDMGNVVSLVTPKIGAGPFFLVVEDALPANLYPEMPVAVDSDKGNLTIGNAHFVTSQAALWNPRPAWQRLRQRASHQLKPVLYQVDDELEGALRILLLGATNDDPGEIRSGAYQLAGRGRGLTPAGDDLLLGVIYGLWVWKPNKEWIQLIVDTAVPRTTTLSAAFLRAAGDGEATIHWHNLVNGRRGAVQRILTIGESSGQDAWAGFVRTGLQLADTG